MYFGHGQCPDLNFAIEPLDELASTVSSLFSPIPNRGVEPLPMINEHPFGPDEKGVSHFHPFSSSVFPHTILDLGFGSNRHGLPRLGDLIPPRVSAAQLSFQACELYGSLRRS